MRSVIGGALLLSGLLGGASYASDADPFVEGERAMREVTAQAAAFTGDGGRRNRLILQLVRSPEAAVSEAELEWLAAYRESHSHDLFAKLYEGYGWLLVAGHYMRQQNYFRAAELAKRGFFLVDEAVEQRPGDWRLRLLRTRVDAAMPAEFGRYVVALEDIEILAEQAAVPASLADLLKYLKFRALEVAGKPAEAQELAAQLAESPAWVVASRENGMSITRAEIDLVLRRVLEIGDE